jgi:hypothetical protein
MFCNSVLEIHLKMTIRVHKPVSETGDQNTGSQKASATKGFQRTLSWDFLLGMKQRMETEVGHHPNCQTVTNMIQIPCKLQVEHHRHRTLTSWYIPQALHGLASHSHPTAQEPQSVAYTNGITVCHTVSVH